MNLNSVQSEPVRMAKDVLSESGINPAYQELLVDFVPLLLESFGSGIVSVVLFGSVARRSEREESDIDLLLIHDESCLSHTEFRDRFVGLRKRFLAGWSEEGVKGDIFAFPHISSVILSKSESEEKPYVFLDILEDGIVLFDRNGFFADLKAEMCIRLEELGSKRISLEDGTWYWDLNPNGKAQGGGHFMNSEETAVALFEEARLIFEKDVSSALGARNYRLVVPRSQEIVELAIKGFIKKNGYEYPRVHDPSALLDQICEERNVKLSSETVVRIQEISSSLAEERAPAFYAERPYTEDEAEDARSNAEFVFQALGKDFLAGEASEG